MTAPIIDKIIGLIGTAAPVLGTVLGSPAAGVGIGLLANLFGTDKDPEKILASILGDPESLIKIKELELKHIEVLNQITAQNYATEVDDRKSARLREMTIKDYIPTILSIGFLLNYAAIQFYCVTHPTNAVDVISARFQDILIMIMSYYFGSSHKSVN